MFQGLSRMWAAPLQFTLTLILGWMFAEKLVQKLVVVQYQLHTHPKEVSDFSVSPALAPNYSTLDT